MRTHTCDVREFISNMKSTDSALKCVQYLCSVSVYAVADVAVCLCTVHVHANTTKLSIRTDNSMTSMESSSDPNVLRTSHSVTQHTASVNETTEQENGRASERASE